MDSGLPTAGRRQHIDSDSLSGIRMLRISTLGPKRSVFQELAVFLMLKAKWFYLFFERWYRVDTRLTLKACYSGYAVYQEEDEMYTSETAGHCAWTPFGNPLDYRYSPESRLTENVAAVMIIKGLRTHSAKTGSIELRQADLDAAARAYIRSVTKPG